jgi:hypothetical protein
MLAKDTEVACPHSAEGGDQSALPIEPDPSHLPSQIEDTKRLDASENGIGGYVVLCILGAVVAYEFTVGVASTGAGAMRTSAPYCEWLLATLCVIALLGFGMIAGRLSVITAEIRKLRMKE